jgi:hypothetical protein
MPPTVPFINFILPLLAASTNPRHPGPGGWAEFPGSVAGKMNRVFADVGSIRRSPYTQAWQEKCTHPTNAVQA